MMKIAWLVNISLPIVAKSMGQKAPVICGWLIQTAELIANQKDIELTIIFPQNSEGDRVDVELEKIRYISFYESPIPVLKYDISIEKQLREIVNKVQPDLMHIWGTEYVHTLAMLNAWGNPDKTVISIQGIMSIYANHYMANIDEKIQHKYTLRDFLRKDNLISQKKKYYFRGLLETEALKKAKHVFGRTDWDEAVVKGINPNINYHHGGEILRKTFYNGDVWDYNQCEKHSIFVTQSYFPIKGFHYLLQALPDILREFPDTKVYVAGDNIFYANSVKEKLKQTYYARYINQLIKENDLGEHIVFTGRLSEEEIKEQYLKANVFLLPSAIENSPNSLAEAMILGIPCVASNVGGISSMLIHEKEGYLYPHDEPLMISYYVKRVFYDEKEACIYAQRGMSHTKERNNIDTCLQQYLTFYREKTI